MILDPALDAAADELLDIATRQTDPETRGQYLHAVDQARAGHAAFRDGARDAFIDRFAKLAGPGAHPDPADTHVNPGALQLVQTRALENEIAIGNLAMRLKDLAGDELFEFTQRVGALLGRPDLLEVENPLGPSAVACGVYGGLARLALRDRAERPLGNLVANRLGTEVQALYEELNQLLAERGVKGAGRARIVKSESSRAHKGEDGGARGSLPAGDVFAQLQTLLARQRGPGMAASPIGPIGPAGGASPPAGVGQYGAAGSAQPGPGEIGQAGAGGFGVPGSGFMLATPAMVNWLTEVQRGGEAAAAFAIPATPQAVNVLRGLRQSEAGQRFSDTDGTTCDLVAMMFDHVFSDPRIPDAIKAQLARLQIPTLKAAMLDHGFFSNEAHPARQLLDRLGAAAVGWQGTAESSDPIYGTVERIVQGAIDGFGADLGELEALNAEAEQLASLEEERSAKLTERSIAVVAARERTERAQETARDVVQQRLHEAPLPEPVRAIMHGIWRRVLASAHEQEGYDSATWCAALETMDNLVWSVRPKSGAEERTRLVKMLPGLLKALDAGMEITGLDAAERKNALDALVPLHAVAVRGQAGAPASVPEPVAEPDDAQSFGEHPEADPGEPRELQSTTIERDDVVVETIEVAAPSGRKRRSSPESAARFERGVWLEFAQPDGTSMRARLTWVSPLKGMHVFVNPDHTRTLAFEPEALDEALHSGAARVLSSAPVVTEAMSRVMSDLEQAHGAH